MTKETVNKILQSPCTHKLVHDIIILAHNKDIVDAINDIELAGEILKSKLEWMKGNGAI